MSYIANFCACYQTRSPFEPQNILVTPNDNYRTPFTIRGPLRDPYTVSFLVPVCDTVNNLFRKQVEDETSQTDETGKTSKMGETEETRMTRRKMTTRRKYTRQK